MIAFTNFRCTNYKIASPSYSFPSTCTVHSSDSCSIPSSAPPLSTSLVTSFPLLPLPPFSHFLSPPSLSLLLLSPSLSTP